LTSSNQKGLFETIISRCQIIRFKPLAVEEVNDILVKDFSIDKEEARFLSALSGANVGKALSLKDKDALSWKNNVIDDFKQQRGVPSQDMVILSNKRNIQIEAMDILINFYRDLLVYKFTKETHLLVNIDRLDLVSDMAERLSADKIQDCIDEIKKAKALLEANVNAKLTIRSLQEKLAV
jgi:DNA polymerase-3 subunit delta'